jgi:hypothetical protein
LFINVNKPFVFMEAYATSVLYSQHPAKG